MAQVTKEWILAGKAIFTIENDKGNHWTFQVSHVPANDRWPEAYFVSLLTGPDNENDYQYFGRLYAGSGAVGTTAKSAKFNNTYALLLINRVMVRVWANDHQAFESRGYKLHHVGRCGRCGRTLTTPQSVEAGFGPECLEILAGGE